MEAAQIVFLVRGMDAIVLEPKSDENGIHVQDLLELTINRDRPAHGPDENGFE